LPFVLQLSAAVQEAKASSILSTGSVDLRSVGSYLRSKHGYLVALRKANISKRPKAYLRQLRHDFLVVRGLPTIEGLDILVDVNFRDHFRVAHATPWYSKMLAALPQDWVGSAQALAPLVGLMSAGMHGAHALGGRESASSCIIVHTTKTAQHQHWHPWRTLSPQESRHA
jgi:uncharacterized protein (TIGR01615 family)